MSSSGGFCFWLSFEFEGVSSFEGVFSGGFAFWLSFEFEGDFRRSKFEGLN